MSDYKRGKNNCEVWADRLERMVIRASGLSNPIGKMVEYGTALSKRVTVNDIPQGVEFTDPLMRATHRIVMQVIPIHQREILIEYLFGEEKKRETSEIKSIYKTVGRKLRNV